MQIQIKQNRFVFSLCGWQWNYLLCRSPNRHHEDKVCDNQCKEVAQKLDMSRKRSCTFLLRYFSHKGFSHKGAWDDK